MSDTKTPQRRRFLQKLRIKHELLERAERPTIRDFMSSEIIRWLVFLNGFVIVMISGVVAWFVHKIDYPIVLHYNVFFGVDVVGTWHRLYWIILFGVAIFVVNTAIAWWLYHYRERIASYSILLGALLVQVAIVISIASIMIVN